LQTTPIATNQGLGLPTFERGSSEVRTGDGARELFGIIAVEFEVAVVHRWRCPLEE
jgi:hypothetical protein